MSCKKCIENPVWKFTNKQQLCKTCFVDYFERKVRGTIRKFNTPINPVIGDSLNAKVISNIIKDLPKRKGKVSNENLDDVSISVLTEMIYGKSENLNKFLPTNQPLYFLSDKEIELFAKIKDIQGSVKKHNAKQEKINDFIKKIEQKNPDIRQNIIKSINVLS